MRLVRQDSVRQPHSTPSGSPCMTRSSSAVFSLSPLCRDPHRAQRRARCCPVETAVDGACHKLVGLPRLSGLPPRVGTFLRDAPRRRTLARRPGAHLPSRPHRDVPTGALAPHGGIPAERLPYTRRTDYRASASSLRGVAMLREARVHRGIRLTGAEAGTVSRKTSARA